MIRNSDSNESNDKLFQEALDKYNARYNNQLYEKAKAGKSNDYAIRLQEHALFLCGSPYSKPMKRASQEAMDFLGLFSFESERIEEKANEILHDSGNYS